MISKEKKTAIINEYARKAGDKRSSENGWSETWTPCISEENRSGRLSCTDRKTWYQKIINNKKGRIFSVPAFVK